MAPGILDRWRYRFIAVPIEAPHIFPTVRRGRVKNTSPRRTYYATWLLFPLLRAYLIISQWYSSRTTQTQPNPFLLETENFGEMDQLREGYSRLKESLPTSDQKASKFSLLERGTLTLSCIKFSVLITYCLATGHIKYLEVIKGESRSPLALFAFYLSHHPHVFHLSLPRS